MKKLLILIGLSISYLSNAQITKIWVIQKNEYFINCTKYNNNYVPNYTVFDLKVTAFMTAIKSSDTTIRSGLNTFVTSCKYYDIWNYFVAIYPIVGGSSDKHAYNLVDTSLFKITWYGSITHNSNGITGDGSTGYGDTHIVPSTSLSLNNTCIGVYVRNNTGTGYDIGGSNPNNSCKLYLIPRFTDDTFLGGVNQTTNTTFASTVSTGLWLENRINASSFSITQNNVLLTYSNVSSTCISDQSIYILRTPTSGSFYSNHNLSFIIISKGMDTKRLYRLGELINNLQTKLGRNVY